jgi:hypothetical protein
VLRVVSAALVAVAVSGLVAPVAAAHQGNLNFRSHVRAIRPAVSGIDVQVLNFDDSLELDNNSGRTVIVRGYRGEPYARIAADGTVAVNHNSPAYYLNDDRFAEGVTVPASATPSATPDWQTVDKTGRFAWHDHRIHWMARSVPPQVKDQHRRTKVFDWKVPLSVDGKPGAIDGSLVWVGKHGGGVPIAAIVAIVLVLIGGPVFVAVVRRRRTATTSPTEAW